MSFGRTEIAASPRRLSCAVRGQPRSPVCWRVRFLIDRPARIFNCSITFFARGYGARHLNPIIAQPQARDSIHDCVCETSAAAQSQTELRATRMWRIALCSI